jgi:uncharacterized membrane protein
MTNIINEDLWKLAITELETTEGWDYETDNENIKIYSKMLFEKECNFKSYKMITTIDRPIELVYKSYMDHQSRPNYIESVEIAKMVHEDQEFEFFFHNSQEIILTSSIK